MKKYAQLLVLTITAAFCGGQIGIQLMVSPWLTAAASVVLVAIGVSWPGVVRQGLVPNALPGVNIVLQNGALGALQATDDGVCGMVLSGISEGTYVLGTPVLLRSYQDALALGLTTQVNRNPFALKQIREFFLEAGDGAKLWVMLVANTMTVTQMADLNNTTGARVLLDNANRSIRYLGLLRNISGLTVTTTNGMDSDIQGGSVNAQVLATTYAGNPYQAPFRVLLGAVGVTDTVNATSLLDGNTLTRNRVSIVLGDTEPTAGQGAAVGLVLGRKARIPVQRKISAVADGPLNITTAYIGGVLAERYNNTDMIHDKRFITFRTYAGKDGYFFSDDPTRTAVTDDYAYLGRGAVIDKAQRIVYTAYVNEVGGEVPIDNKGKMEPGYCAYLEELADAQLRGIMVANREVSGVAVKVDPNQNVLATNKVTSVLKITPVGYSQTIEVQLGFNNPAS